MGLAGTINAVNKVDDCIEKLCKYYGQDKVQLIGENLFFYKEHKTIAPTVLGGIGIAGLGAAAVSAGLLTHLIMTGPVRHMVNGTLEGIGSAGIGYVLTAHIYIGGTILGGLIGGSSLLLRNYFISHGILKEGPGFILDNKGIVSEATRIITWNKLGNIQQNEKFIRLIDTKGNEIAQIQKNDARFQVDPNAFLMAINYYWKKYKNN
jgi:hypothetical protein